MRRYHAGALCWKERALHFHSDGGEHCERVSTNVNFDYPSWLLGTAPDTCQVDGNFFFYATCEFSGRAPRRSKRRLENGWMVALTYCTVVYTVWKYTLCSHTTFSNTAKKKFGGDSKIFGAPDTRRFNWRRIFGSRACLMSDNMRRAAIPSNLNQRLLMSTYPHAMSCYSAPIAPPQKYVKPYHNENAICRAQESKSFFFFWSSCVRRSLQNQLIIISRQQKGSGRGGADRGGGGIEGLTNRQRRYACRCWGYGRKSKGQLRRLGTSNPPHASSLKHRITIELKTSIEDLKWKSALGNPWCILIAT